MGRHSPGDITWDGETPFENSWECHRRHVANINTKQQSYTIEKSTSGAHRALSDVLTLERVVNLHSLAACLANLTVRSPQVQLGLWTNQKTSFNKAAALITAIGKPSLTPTQAKKLDSLDLSFAELTHLHQHSSTLEVFLAALKAKGVRSKALREKLGKALC